LPAYSEFFRNESNADNSTQVDTSTDHTPRDAVTGKCILEVVASIVLSLTSVTDNPGNRAQHQEEVNVWKELMEVPRSRHLGSQSGLPILVAHGMERAISQDKAALYASPDWW